MNALTQVENKIYEKEINIVNIKSANIVNKNKLIINSKPDDCNSSFDLFSLSVLKVLILF